MLKKVKFYVKLVLQKIKQLKEEILMDKPIESVAKRLNYAMSVRHITQAELSEKTKISTGSLSQYMNGKITPKQDRIFILSRALSISEAWLMGYDAPMEKQRVDRLDFNQFHNVDVTEDVKLLVERYDKLNNEKKQYVLKTLEYLLEK